MVTGCARIDPNSSGKHGWLEYGIPVGHIRGKTLYLDKKSTEQEYEGEPSGEPFAESVIHEDGGGWTVSAFQGVEKQVVLRVGEGREAVRFYFNPALIPVGILLSPPVIIGAIVLPLDSNKYTEEQKVAFRKLVTVWSLFLVGLSPSASIEDQPSEDFVYRYAVPSKRALTKGRARFLWEGPRTVQVEYPLQEDGRAVIRLSHLARAINAQGFEIARFPNAPVYLEVEVPDHTPWRHPVTVSWYELNKAIGDDVAPIPVMRLPRRLAVAISPVVDATSAEDGRFQQLAVALLRKQGIPVVTRSTALMAIDQEQQFQAMGGVADHEMRSVGVWRGATLMMVPRLIELAAGKVMSVQLVDVETGLVLGAFSVGGGTDEVDVIFDETIDRLERLLSAYVESHPLLPKASLQH